MSRSYQANPKKTKPRYRINAKNYNIIPRKLQFSPKNLIDRQFGSTDKQDENSTPTSTPIISSNSQDNSFTSVKKLRFSIGSFKIVYRTSDYLMTFTRRIQSYRDETRIYKYFAQQISSYTGGDNKTEYIATPFGSAKVWYRHYKFHDVDKVICGGCYSSYTSILSVLNTSNYSQEIAESILKYLQTPAINNFKDFNDLKVDQSKYINKLSHKELKCANALSAILMVSEPSKNRNYGGGARERALLRTMLSSNGRFTDVFNKKFYPQMQKGGAAIARTSTSIPNELNSKMSPQGLDLMNQLPITPPTHSKLL